MNSHVINPITLSAIPTHAGRTITAEQALLEAQARNHRQLEGVQKTLFAPETKAEKEKREKLEESLRLIQEEDQRQLNAAAAWSGKLDEIEKARKHLSYADVVLSNMVTDDTFAFPSIADRMQDAIHISHSIDDIKKYVTTKLSWDTAKAVRDLVETRLVETVKAVVAYGRAEGIKEDQLPTI